MPFDAGPERDDPDDSDRMVALMLADRVFRQQLAAAAQALADRQPGITAEALMQQLHTDPHFRATVVSLQAQWLSRRTCGGVP